MTTSSSWDICFFPMVKLELDKKIEKFIFSSELIIIMRGDFCTNLFKGVRASNLEVYLGCPQSEV